MNSQPNVLPLKPRKSAPPAAKPMPAKDARALLEPKGASLPDPRDQKIHFLDQHLLNMQVNVNQFITRIDFLEVQVKGLSRMVTTLTDAVKARAAIMQ